MAIQDDNTILNKGDLKAYHERIAPMLGGTFMVGTNNSDYYSTDEKIVGVWTDGKPIYQKTWINVDISGMIDGVNHNIIDITSLHADTTVKVEAISHQVTSGQKFDYPNNFFTPNNTPTEEPLKANVWRRAENYIGFNGTNLPITSVDVTFCYTKTTDAASSATTTPGAYDINFPNTWPANTEIYFGNGVYGYRETGNAAITANTVKSWDAIPITRTANTKIYNYGGTWKRSSAIPAAADTVFGIPLSDDPNINSGVIIGSQAIIFTVKDAFTGTVTYDFYVTYTK